MEVEGGKWKVERCGATTLYDSPSHVLIELSMKSPVPRPPSVRPLETVITSGDDAIALVSLACEAGWR